MTASSPAMTHRLRVGLAATALAGCLAAALLAGSPARAEDANPVLAKVNGSEIRQSDVKFAEDELGPSLAQMDPATKQQNVLSFLITAVSLGVLLLLLRAISYAGRRGISLSVF